MRLLKEKTSVIIKSFFVALVGLGTTAYIGAIVLIYFFKLDFFTSLLHTIPLSVLSSAIILPSIDSLSKNKKEFMIYQIKDMICINLYKTNPNYLIPISLILFYYKFKII